MSYKGSTDTTETVTVRLPQELLAMLDGLVEKKLFSSRSEAVREFCREYVIENRRPAQRAASAQRRGDA